MKRTFLSLSVALCAFAISQEVAAQTTTARVPLFEVFTSSTCPPCRPGNSIYEGVVSSKPETEYVSVKYQQNFPGNGDPYGTSETVSRRSYYAVTGIPNMQIDGGWNKNAQSFTTAIYDQYKAVPATYQLSGEFKVVGRVVTAKTNYKALTAGTNARLFVAILERKTVKNKTSNGETEFINVVKKMLPTQSGTDISATAVGIADSNTQTFTFPDSSRTPTSYADRITQFAVEHSVEDFKNLVVVAWVQGSDKQVYQAANLKRAVSTAGINNATAFSGDIKMYPVPAQNQLNISLNMQRNEQVSVSLVNLAGQVVATQGANLSSGSNVITVPTADLPTGTYTVIVLDSKNNVQAQMVTVAH